MSPPSAHLPRVQMQAPQRQVATHRPPSTLIHMLHMLYLSSRLTHLLRVQLQAPQRQVAAHWGRHAHREPAR